MKKVVSVIAALALFLLLMLSMSVSAASANANLTGPDTVRAGDTVTLTFNLNGKGIFGASGTLSFDKSQLTMTGTKQKIGSPWMVEFNGNNFVAYDNNLSAPINKNTALFTVTFKVGNVAPGTKLTVSYTDVKASDGAADSNIGTVSYSVTVSEPLSTDNKLSSLTVGNATISPAFDAGTTTYTAEVPFSVSKLDVKATAADGKAKVSINNPTLKPDATTNVTVTVTAENGAKKTYTIKVKREKDPNYVASENNDLSGITVEGFLLSPPFSKDVTQYVVWLPYEADSIRIGGKAADGKASVEVQGGDALAAGQDNEVKVICSAENGEEKVYTIIVKRAAAHDGSVEQKPTTAPTTTAPTTVPTAPSQPTNSDAPAGGLPLWLVIVAAVAGLAIGFGIGFVVKKK